MISSVHNPISGSLEFFRFPGLSALPGISHFITSRSGGKSEGNYSSLNLGLNTADDPRNVIRNREILAEALSVPPGRFVYANQVHDCRIQYISGMCAGSGTKAAETAIQDTDAMVTNIPGICLMVLTADCVPVLLYDPVRKVVAATHAGWRGTVKQIARNTVRFMMDEFGCQPKDILAGIGPSIGPCCYEVGEEVEQSVIQAFGTAFGYLVEKDKVGKPCFDLWYANQQQLIAIGLLTEHIETAGICTHHNPGKYFSSRASGGRTGRFGAGILLLKS